MEKAEKPTKRRTPDAGADSLRKRARSPEADENEVEEFFATLRRMRSAVKYFERSGGDGVRRGPATWRAMLERGAELPVNGPSSKAAPAEEPGRERAGVIPDLNVSPDEISARD